MTDLYVTGSVAIVVVLFVVGLSMLIRGYRKYNFNVLALLVPFVGVLFSFPVYYALKERWLKKNDAPLEQRNRARGLTIISLIFVIAAIVVSVTVGVWFFVGAFDTMQAGGDIEVAVWAKWHFLGTLVVCVAYLVAILAFGRSKNK